MSRISRFAKRNSLAARKVIWRRFHNHSPRAKAVYVLGAQRSGTTLLLECLERSLEIDVLGESSSAMVDFRIKSDEEIRKIVTSSRHRIVVFKPLTDSHRAREFLNLTPGSAAIWAFRRVEDRANSAVAKFGDHNLQILRAFSKGKELDRWQAQGLTDEDHRFIRSFDYTDMSPETAAAIFWYIRNRLYFSNGLDKMRNVLPLAYEDLASRPEAVMRGICRFINARFTPHMVRDVHAKSIGLRESNLPLNIQQLCSPMYERLHLIQKRLWTELDLEEASTAGLSLKA